MKIEYKYAFIEAFNPWEEDWNPELLKYLKTSKALPKSQASLSERIRECIYILKKNGINEFYKPRCGAAGYYHSYDGFAIPLSKVTLDIFKQLEPLVTYIDVCRISYHQYPGAVMQFVFKYSELWSDEADSICEPDYGKHIYPSWMKQIKWHEKFNALEI